MRARTALIAGLALVAGRALVATAAPGPQDPPQDPAQVGRGKAVYEAQHCALCHAVGGRGNAKGPLDRVGATLSADDIRTWIVSPKEKASPTGRKPEMRAYPSLPPADLEALIAYLRSLKG